MTDDRQTDHAMGKCVAIGRIAYTSRVILCGKVDRNKKKIHYISHVRVQRSPQ